MQHRQKRSQGWKYLPIFLFFIGCEKKQMSFSAVELSQEETYQIENEQNEEMASLPFSHENLSSGEEGEEWISEED